MKRDKLAAMQATGGKKNDESKPRYDLIPPDAIEAVAHVFRIGAQKYGERDWEKGLKWGRVFRAMMSHAWAFWRGETHDKEDGQEHLASVAWCALVLLSYDRHCREWDDRPWGYGEKNK